MINLMKDLIFIAGAPGSGKSTIAKALHEKLDHLIMHQQQDLLEFQKIQIEMLNDIIKNQKK